MMYQPSIGQQSSGTNILTQTTLGEASPHTPININESHTKPLADMERLRKERLGNKVGPNSKKFRQLRAILDSKIEKSQKSKQTFKMNSQTSNGWAWRPDSSSTNNTMLRNSPSKNGGLKMKRSGSTSQFNSLYKHDSEVVPQYYSRPGPGNYQIDQGLGKYTGVSFFQNSPSFGFSKPKTMPGSFASIANFKKLRQHNTISHQHLPTKTRSPSASSLG